MDFRLVTVANKRPTEWYYTFDEFFKSLGENEILVLGTHAEQYGGLGSKVRLLYNAIMNGEIKEKYLVFCDCFDLVFAFPPEHLFNSYMSWFPNVPLVISAEKNCFPSDLKEEYDKLYNGSSPYKYLNSGMIVGEVAAMLNVLESMDAKNVPNDYWDAEKNCMINPNDQFYYQKEFLKQPVEIYLDREQILCNTLHSVELKELSFEPQGIRNIETGRVPCSWHFNGNAKTENNLRPTILKHLNLL